MAEMKHEKDITIKYLKERTVKDLLKNIKEVSPIHVEANDSLKDTLEKFREHEDICAFPIYNKEEDSFMGYIDLFSITSFILKPYLEEKDTKYLDDFDLDSKTILQLYNKIEIPKLFDVKLDHNMYDVVKHMGQNGIDFAVVLEDKKVKHMFSQRDILMCLQEKRKEALPIAEYNLKELGLVGLQKAILSESYKGKAIEAYYKMVKENFNTIGIVDDDLKLVGDLSVVDMKDIDSKKLSLLKESVVDFLKKLHGKDKLEKPVVVTEDCKLIETINEILEHKVRCAWLIDPKEKPVGVITMSDILRAIV